MIYKDNLVRIKQIQHQTCVLVKKYVLFDANSLEQFADGP